MKPAAIYTTIDDAHPIVEMVFDVSDSTALHALSVQDHRTIREGHTDRRRIVVDLTYKSDPSASYLYTIEEIAGIADLYLELMGQESAGRFATYARNNADYVDKYKDGAWKNLPARKTLAKETA